MSKEIANTSDVDMSLIEELVLNNDFSKMSPESRVDYTVALCKHLGLNPVTRPFEFQNFQGRTTLYANKSCTDQLRSINRISLEITGRDMVNDLYIVTAKATERGTGRTDESTGVVAVHNKSGEMLANLMMKAETKAKRRVTLSICGLGVLDESERDGAEVGFGSDRPAFEPAKMNKKPLDQIKAAASAAGIELKPASKVEKPEPYGKERASKVHQFLDEKDIDLSLVAERLVNEHGVDPETIKDGLESWPYSLNTKIRGILKAMLAEMEKPAEPEPEPQDDDAPDFSVDEE